MEAKAVVLKAKELLSRMENASYLTREAFVAVCTSATKHFLKRVQRERQQRDVFGSGQSEAAGPDGWTVRDTSLLSMLIEQEAAALVRKLGTPGKVSSHKDMHSSRGLVADRSVEQPSFQLANVSDDFAGAAGGNVSGGSSGTDQRFAVLPQCTVQAAAVVKEVLDEAYASGRLRRSDYQQVVVAVVNHVLRRPDRRGVEGITSEDVALLREGALACLSECFAKYSVEMFTNEAEDSKAARWEDREEGAPAARSTAPRQAKAHRHHTADTHTSGANRSASNGSDGVHVRSIVSGGISAPTAPTPALGSSSDGTESQNDRSSSSFEEQVAQLKRILHASLDSAACSNGAAVTVGGGQTSSNAADPSSSENFSAVADRSRSSEDRRRVLLAELKGLHDEAGLLQAKMNIVLRELLELNA